MAKVMKENQHVQPIIAEDFKSVMFKTRGHADLTLHMDKISDRNKERAACVGFAQVRIVDAAAIPVARKDGSIIPEAERIEMKYTKMRELIEFYETGTEDWTRVSEGGGGRSITVEAIAAIKGWTYEETEQYVEKFAVDKHEGDTKAALAFLRQGARVAEQIELIRKARMPKPKVDADAALDELTK